tara:strand:+ start:10333 stop:11118 length:786 start_codon:yes stop_codon:yes gene_type:complete
MSSFKHLSPSLQHIISQKSLLKVIAGLNNFDTDSVIQIAKAACYGGADLLDVACDPQIVALAVKYSKIPICVSAVEPSRFLEVIDHGVSMIEIGNFDSFYSQGRFFDALEVLSITKETRRILPDIPLSVTVPHTLPLDQQSQLALDLVHAGADLIQTEGGKSARALSPGSLGLIEKAAPTLAATHAITSSFIDESVAVPVICASGLSPVTVPMAISLGASGVGVGSAINRLDNEIEMVAVIKSLRAGLMFSSKSFSIKNVN